MGNYISHGQSDNPGKVILSDGRVHEYDEPLTVAELMLEYPQQAVIEFQSAVSCRRPRALPADKELEKNKLYLMLPIKKGKPVALSSEESRQLLLRANSVLKSRPALSSPGFLPWFAWLCPAETGERRRFMLLRKENLVDKSEEVAKPEIFPEILEGRPEYLSRQFSGKGWKPSLDTINEMVMKKKTPHWLF